MVFPEKHQSTYCLFQIDSPMTEIVTQASTGAYLQMAPGTSMVLLFFSVPYDNITATIGQTFSQVKRRKWRPDVTVLG